jgi:hydroxypyruvate isomerase
VAQGDLSRRLETSLPLISHLQVADVPGRHEPGAGEINWDHLFRRIDELGYQGWIGCEYQPLATTEAGLIWRDRYRLRPS